MTSFLSLAALAAMTIASACAATGSAAGASLIGAEWVVEDINGGGVIDSSRATLGFGEDGRVAGRASCNTYSASYSLTGAGLTIGPVAVTRKACAPALMDQEQKFLAAPDGSKILARR